ncbi:MAG: hypothetical protein GY928_20285, partial [Colwellia sp.]|nr:hypothetical protein [Colwellia sp.]
MTRDLKPGDKVKWFTSSEWPEPVGIVKEITPKRVKIEVTRIDEQSSVHYVKKTSLIKVHEPSNISQSQANSLNVESSVQDKILSVVVASVIVGGLLFIAGIFGNVSGEFLFWGVFGSAVGTFCIGIILIVLENV